MKNFETMKFVNDEVNKPSSTYDFSNRRSEDLMYIILNPDEHTALAVEAAKIEIKSRNISIENRAEVVSDAIHIKNIELFVQEQSLSKNERIFVCMMPPKINQYIALYYKNRGCYQKIKEMESIPFLEKLKYICLSGLILFVMLVSSSKLYEHKDKIRSALMQFFD
ncbi:MAG: hypothetical protein AABZ32_03165 [Bacteroidota bacterium]